MLVTIRALLPELNFRWMENGTTSTSSMNMWMLTTRVIHKPVTNTTNASMAKAKPIPFHRTWNTTSKVGQCLLWYLYTVISLYIDMVQHLQNQFPTMHKLYNIMSSRKTPPTPLEVLIATKLSTVSEKEVSDYLQTLDAAPQATLPNIFLNQTAVCSPFFLHGLLSIAFLGSLGPSWIWKTPYRVDYCMWPAFRSSWAPGIQESP